MTPKQHLKKSYGFDFPEDFFQFYEFAQRLKLHPELEGPYEKGLGLLGMFLDAPFKVFEEKFDPSEIDIIESARNYRDPPEFFTVVYGKIDGLHWGYYVDIPSKPKVDFWVASYFNNDAYDVSFSGKTLFFAARMQLEGYYGDALDALKTKKNKTYYENQLKQLTIIREILRSYDTNDIQEIGAAYYDKYNAIRYDKCIAKTRGKEGIVALESQFRWYKGQEDFNIWNYQPDENRVRVLQKEAQQAIAEGFPATALKIGKDLWVYHEYNLYIHQILAAAYIALERPILLNILRKYIAKKNILDLPEFQDALQAPMDQITLKLYGKRIYELSKEIGVFKNLEKLDLGANELTTLPLQMGELTQLKELNLNSNKFISLPNVIGRLGQLKELRLQRNNLKKLPNTFGQLQNLEKLYFLDAKFERFPKVICSLKKLKTLCIRFTEFEALPEAINNLENLEELEIYTYQPITTFPENLSKLQQLKKLTIRAFLSPRLGKGILPPVPEAIGDLLSLEKLILQGFDRFPETIKQLKKLEGLTLINHRMPVLPAFIFQLKGLKTLSITNGNMTKLPSAIGTLPAIELLNLSRNQLEILPPEIIQLEHLKWLRLSKNRCSEKEFEQYEKWLPNVKITY